MKNEKHTPGPWSEGAPTDRYIREDATGHCIAMVQEDSGHPDPEHAVFMPMEANARLIAAAPELLAALKRALVALNNMERVLQNGYIHAPHYEEAREAARAAIDKAEGRG